MLPYTTLFTLFFVSLSVHIKYGIAEGVHVFPSGRRIPLTAIRSHPFGADEDATARLYELSDRHVLSGQKNVSVPLKAYTRTSPVHHHPDLHVALNGESAAHAESPGEVREGPGFAAAYIHGDSLPTEVVLRGATLMPLHFGEHPGIYIAAPHSSPSYAAPADAVAHVASEGVGAGDTGAGAVEGTGAEAGGTDGAELSSSPVLHQKRQRRFCGPNATKRNYEIAASFDNTLCALYDNDYTRVLFRTQLAVGWADKAFKEYLCVRTALVYVEAHCKDPQDPVRRWPKSTNLNLLNRFQKFWQKSRGYVQRDIAIFFTTVTANRVFLDSSCSKKIGYAVSPLTNRAIASSLAYSLGARQASSGLMAGIGVLNSIELAASSAKLVRDYLEFNGKSWCVTQGRRYCTPKNCSGRCVQGACVTGKLNVPQKCAASLKGNWQLKCVQYRPLTSVSTFGNVINVRYALQFGRLYVQFSKQNRFSFLSLPAVMAYVKVGSSPTLTEGELDLSDTLTFWFNIADLPNPRPGKSCCGQTLHLTVRVLYCTSFVLSCTTKTRGFTWKLPCSGICKRPGGTPLPMKPWRKCPVCKRG